MNSQHTKSQLLEINEDLCQVGVETSLSKLKLARGSEDSDVLSAQDEMIQAIINQKRKQKLTEAEAYAKK